MSARDGLYVPPEPEWLREQSYDEIKFLRSLREEPDMTTTAITTQAPPDAARSVMLRPVAPIDQIIAQQSELRTYIKSALKDGRDFGTIPGVDKSSLLKPGAERINTAYGVFPRFEVTHQEIDHDREVKWVKRRKEWVDRRWTGNWLEEHGTSLGLYSYTVRCELVERSSGAIVAECIGHCSTMESKYIDRPRDSQNTALKMAEKRAFVGATLLAYGLSDEFTQDVEDTPEAAAVTTGTDDAPTVTAAPKCPKCSGAMWDNRARKTNPKAPDFKCKTNSCDGVIWPPKGGTKSAAPKATGNYADDPGAALQPTADDDELPFN